MYCMKSNQKKLLVQEISPAPLCMQGVYGHTRARAHTHTRLTDLTTDSSIWQREPENP